MKKIISFLLLLIVISGCVSQNNLYYDKRGQALLENELESLSTLSIYLILPVKSSNNRDYEICIGWEMFFDVFMRNENYLVSYHGSILKNENYYKGLEKSKKLVKEIYSQKNKYFFIENIDSTEYRGFIIDSSYYENKFKNADLKTVLNQYMSSRSKENKHKSQFDIDYSHFDNNKPSKERVEEELALIKYLTLNGFGVYHSMNGLSAYDFSQMKNKIPWKEIKESWK